MAAADSINETKFSLNTPLSTIDPELYGMLRDEKKRQRESIILIASENYVCFSCSVTCVDAYCQCMRLLNETWFNPIREFLYLFIGQSCGSRDTKQLDLQQVQRRSGRRSILRRQRAHRPH